MIELTVSLPLYSANRIAWLALESLCNQRNLGFEWELIICEEDNEFKIPYLEEYRDRLKKAGCAEIKYISLKEKVLLAKKWQIMGKVANKNSKAFLLQAGDCYSSRDRLALTYNRIMVNDYDWCDYAKGYFYSFISKKLVLYNVIAKTNLDMGFKTKYARNIPDTTLERGIDGFLLGCCQAQKKQQLKVFNVTDLYRDRLDTHGLNNISKQRDTYFSSKPNIFTPSIRFIDSMELPPKVIRKLKAINV